MVIASLTPIIFQFIFQLWTNILLQICKVAKSSYSEVMNMQFTLAQLSMCDAIKEGQVYTHHKPECIASPHQAGLTSHIHGGASGWRLSLTG